MQPTTEFSALTLPTSELTSALGDVYKIVTPEGKLVTVEAGSASEALEKSGVSAPIRIINAASEQAKLLEESLLKARENTVETDISLKDPAPDMIYLLHPESEKRPAEEPFVEMELGALGSPAQEEEESAPPAPVPPEEEERTATSLDSAAPEPAAAPAEQEEPPAPTHDVAAEPEKELTPEEVETLLATPSNNEQ